MGDNIDFNKKLSKAFDSESEDVKERHESENSKEGQESEPSSEFPKLGKDESEVWLLFKLYLG